MKPFYIVFKHDLKHPLRESWNKRKNQYEIWKEYDQTMIWDAPYYEVLGYFDTKKEAQAFVKTNPVEAV
jgi:hypothetical protein